MTVTLPPARLWPPARLMLLVLLATGAAAQDFRSTAPRPLPAPPPAAAPALPDPPTAAPAEAAPPLLPALKGLVFVGSLAAVQAGATVAPVGGLDVAGVPLLASDPAFAVAARAWLGKPVTLADLDRIARLAIDAHRVAGRPLADVAPPPQDISTGVVQFVVTEYRTGAVAIEGNRHVSSDRIRRAVRLQPGDPIDQNRLLEDLDWIATNPFRRAELLYRRGQGPQTTDVVLRVTDRAPIRVYAAYDNHGPPAVGRSRLSAGFNWGDAFGTDAQLSYQGSVSPELMNSPRPRFQAHSVTLLQPLASRRTLLLFGTWQQARPDLGNDLGQEGRNLQLSGRFSLPVGRSGGGRATLSLGYDYKQTNNNLLFGGTSIGAQTTRIHQVLLDFNGGWRSAGGVTGIDATVVFSPGGIGAGNNDAAFQPGPGQTGTPFARASYAYLRIALSQTTPLWRGLEARSRLTGQIATGNLLPTEQLAVAGPGAVRGYDPNAALGSEGLLAALELWLPPIAVPGATRRQAGQLQMGTFIEAGQAGNPQRLEDEPRQTHTAAAGLAASWNLGTALQLRADYGWQLRALPRQPRGSLGQISLTVGI